MTGKPSKMIVYVGLGSNLHNPVEQINRARHAIAQSEGVEERGFSSLYSSPPMGPQDQPDYINAVMAIETGLTGQQLLHRLQGIENAQGRVRSERWGARTLDLDILLYGDCQIDTDTLRVPHPGIHQRAFVLYPLAEIAPPDLCIPEKGQVADLIQHCPRSGLEIIDS